MQAQLEIQQMLRNQFEERRSRNNKFSLRSFAKKLDMSPSAVSEILNGKRDVSLKMAEKIAFRLNLNPQESQSILGHFQKVKGPKVKNTLFGRQTIQLQIDQYNTMSEWHHFAILSLIETKGFQHEPKWIAARLGITTKKATDALDRLVRLELIKQTKDKKYKKTGKHFSTTTDISSQSLRKTHHQNLELAHDKLDSVELLKRDFTAMTMAVDMKKLPQAKEMIKQFRRELCDFLETDEQTEVYKICIQLFPLTEFKTTGDN